MDKQAIVKLLCSEYSFLSIHEHIGNCELYFNNGNKTSYSQTGKQIVNKIKILSSKLNLNNAYALVYSMPPYRIFQKEGVNILKASQVNSIFMEELISLNKQNLLPSIFLSVREGSKSMEEELKKYSPISFCIKLHPAADCVKAKDVADSGVFELAKKYNLPITIHCSRPGSNCDIKDINKYIIPIVNKLGCKLNIAHLGFLNKDIEYIRNNKFVYMDISPWSILLDQHFNFSYKYYDAIKILKYLISKFPDQLMFGMDTPFDIQIWEDGSIHGNGWSFDSDFIVNNIKSLNHFEIKYNIFYKNAINFLL